MSQRSFRRCCFICRRRGASFELQRAPHVESRYAASSSPTSGQLDLLLSHSDLPCQICADDSEWPAHRLNLDVLVLAGNSDRCLSTRPWRSLLGFELTVRLSSHMKAHMGRGGPVVRLADRKTTVSRVHPP